MTDSKNLFVSDVKVEYGYFELMKLPTQAVSEAQHKTNGCGVQREAARVSRPPEVGLGGILIYAQLTRLKFFDVYEALF